MRFAYTYRSSDGQRHTAEIEADSRDAAFAKVRAELGIKPIRVTAAEGPEERRQDGASPKMAIKGGAGRAANVSAASRGGTWRAAILAAIALAAAGGALWRFGGHGVTTLPVDEQDARTYRNPAVGGEAEISERYGKATYPIFTNLLARSQALEESQRDRTEKLNLDLLHNYALIRRLADLSELYEEIDKGRQIVNDVREEARAIFADIYEMFPPECVNERVDAEKMYDGLMTTVDAVEQRLDDEEEALVLLDDNRDKWDVQAGRLIFTDTRLEREFKFYNRPTETSSVRWRRDFGHGSIESAPAAVPSLGTKKK